MKIRIVFNDQERQLVNNFCQQLQMPVEIFCKQAVFYSIRDSYKRAQELEKQQQQAPTPVVDAEVSHSTSAEGIANAVHDTTGGISEGNIEQGLPDSGNTNTNTLANS